MEYAVRLIMAQLTEGFSRIKKVCKQRRSSLTCFHFWDSLRVCVFVFVCAYVCMHVCMCVCCDGMYVVMVWTHVVMVCLL